MSTKYVTDREILNLLCSLKHRAEKSDDLSAFAPSFVAVVDQELLTNRNTQVIYGRNGTGKTHLLKCFEEISLHTINSRRVMPIYFDMRELDISRISPDLLEEDVVELFFSNFLYACVEKLEEIYRFIDAGTQLRGTEYEFQITLKMQSAFKAAIKRIRKAFDNKSIRENIESYTKQIKKSSADKTEMNGSGSLGGTGGSFSAGGGVEKVASNEEFIEMVIKASHFIDFAEIRGGFNDVVEALELDHIIFLIDEWSQIDVSIQPIFSELIRRTIGTSNNITCKFAALRFLTSFTKVVNGRRIGLQPGIDITELTDLNHIFTFDLDRQAVRKFLLYILIKHLLEEIGRNYLNKDFENPREFLAGNVNLIFSRLFEHIFESREAFDYFVRASEGNPRDFLAMISECCATHGSAQLPISMKAVQVSAINYFSSTKVANFPDTESDALGLFEKIFAKCLKNKSKIFSVSREIEKESVALKDLWAQRVIHLITDQYEYFNSELGSVEAYVLYAVDYGKILGLRSDKKGGDALEGIVKDAKGLISGLYDGKSHRSILDFIETEDSRIATVKEILGAAPDTASVTDQADILSPEVIFQKVKDINVDDIVVGYHVKTAG